MNPRKCLAYLGTVFAGALFLLLSLPSNPAFACGATYDPAPAPQQPECNPGPAPFLAAGGAGALALGAAAAAGGVALAKGGGSGKDDVKDVVGADKQPPKDDGKSKEDGKKGERRSKEDGGKPTPEHPGGVPRARLQLEAGRADRSIRQVRGVRDPQTRWRAAEENARQRYGGGPERPYPVAPRNHPDFPIKRATVRRVDSPVDLPGGRVLAVEVKMYQQYRRVEVSPGRFVTVRVEVPLTAQILAQIAKDVALRAANPGYSPLWEFIGAGPSQQLRDALVRAGIVFVEHN